MDADPTSGFVISQFVCDLVVWASDGMLTPTSDFVLLQRVRDLVV